MWASRLLLDFSEELKGPISLLAMKLWLLTKKLDGQREKMVASSMYEESLSSSCLDHLTHIV